jgi:ATP-dependent DNA helicase RecQ
VTAHSISPATGEAAATLLRQLAGADAALRDDQATAIGALVDDRRRVLMVQRTGWGKSAVYFIATRLLRDRGAGPTLLVSPLLALMRDQLAAARRMGLTAETVNSTNVEDWEAIEARVAADEVDLLLISPERLNHPNFRRRILDTIVASAGMLVVDEAHCISDHGHDFRPDYRRIADVLVRLDTARAEPVAVLACTATATDRVVADAAAQLAGGREDDTLVLRGPLSRDTLQLAVLDLDDHERRLAWLTTFVRQRRTVGRAGIIYTLTVAAAEATAAWLASTGIDALAYTSQLDADTRRQVEDDLAVNACDVVVATTALSMGYDKPDLGFVVHLGAPSSPVAYYQAIGRAGRAGDVLTPVVLLPTGLDETLWIHFDEAGVPLPGEVDAILAALEGGGPRSLPQLEIAVNLRRSRLELLLKILDVEGVVERVTGGVQATGATYVHDHDRYATLLAGRRAEQQIMREYLRAASTASCRMRLLTGALDDPGAADCGRCDVCTGMSADLELDPTLVDAARDHLRAADVLVPARRRWPSGLDRLGLEERGNIDDAERAQPGRALADGDTSGWRQPVDALLLASAAGRCDTGIPDGLADTFEEVVGGLVAVLARWDWPARPTVMVTGPSRTHAGLLSALASRLAQLGRLPLHEQVLVRPADAARQHEQANSAHQAANALASVQLAGPVPTGPVLLIEPVRRSGWSATVAARRLARAGAGPVLPLVLRVGDPVG